MEAESPQGKLVTDINQPSDDKELWETFKLKPLESLREGIELYNFQQYSIYKALSQPRFVFGLATGTGKTPCALATYEYYKTKYPDTKLLILTEKSAVLQFRGEFDKFFDTDIRALAIHDRMPKFGAKKYKQARLNAYAMFQQKEKFNNLDALIMNYAIFRLDFQHIAQAVNNLIKDGQQFFFILDEATAFKNIQTQTHQRVRRLAMGAHRVLGLTATLTKGKLEEVYAILRGMGIQITETKEIFMDTFCITWQHPTLKYITNIIGYKNVDHFIRIVKPYTIILRKEDVMEYLPPFTLKKVYLEHSTEQFDLISSIYSGLVDVMKFSDFDDFDEQANHYNVKDQSFSSKFEKDGPKQFRMTDALTEVGHIKRALLDPRIVHRNNFDNTDSKLYSPKTVEIIRMLKEDFTTEKIIIYSQSKQYVKLLLRAIRVDQDIPIQYRNAIELTGDITSAMKREENRQLFQTNPAYGLFVMNDAGAMAVNLEAANVMIITTLPATGGNLIQTAGRISRIGSKHKNLLMIHLLMKDSQDEDEYLIINQQMQVMSLVLGEAERGLIDWDLLQEAGTITGEETISSEELKVKSLARLILHKRKKRQTYYLKNVEALHSFES